MEKKYEVLLEILGNIMFITFIVCSAFILITLLIITYRKINIIISQLQNKSLGIICALNNIFFFIIIYLEKIIRLLGLEHKEYMQCILEFRYIAYLEQLVNIITNVLMIVGIIILFVSYIEIAKRVRCCIFNKTIFSEKKWKVIVGIFGIIFGIISLIILGYLVFIYNKEVTEFLQSNPCLNILCMIFRFIIFTFIIFWIILVVLISKFVLKKIKDWILRKIKDWIPRIIINFKNEDEKTSKITNDFSNIIINGGNTASINKLCRNLGDISDDEIYIILKNFTTPQLLGLKSTLKQNEKKKTNLTIKISLTTICSVIGMLIKYLKNDEIINFIELQKDNITVVFIVIILLLCIYLFDPLLSLNKSKRIISSDYLLLIIDNILDFKKDEKKNEARTIIENNESTETEILETVEREGGLKIKIENKKAPVNNTSAEK